MPSAQHVYEARPRKDHRGVDLISDALPFGRLWYGEPNAISNAIGYAKFRSRSQDALIRIYDESGNVIETHEQASEFKEPAFHYCLSSGCGNSTDGLAPPIWFFFAFSCLHFLFALTQFLLPSGFFALWTLRCTLDDTILAMAFLPSAASMFAARKA